MKRILTVLALALLLSAPAYASGYQVEMIVFRDLKPPTDKVPLAPRAPSTSNAVDMDNPTALSNNGIRMNSGGLDGIWRALGNSPTYHPILRVSWVQQGRSAAGAVPLRLHDGKTYTVTDDQGDTQKLYKLDGTATLITQPYLHLRMNLFLISPGQGDAGNAQQTQTDIGSDQDSASSQPRLIAHHLQVNQAMKSGNIRYFDNPAFGVIARVTQLQGGG